MNYHIAKIAMHQLEKKGKREEINILILLAERNVEYKESKNRLSQNS